MARQGKSSRKIRNKNNRHRLKQKLRTDPLSLQIPIGERFKHRGYLVRAPKDRLPENDT